MLLFSMEKNWISIFWFPLFSGIVVFPLHQVQQDASCTDAVWPKVSENGLSYLYAVLNKVAETQVFFRIKYVYKCPTSLA